MNQRTWLLRLAGAAVLSVASGTALAKPPAWVDGKDPKYNRKEFLLGVGKGPNKKASDIDARAEISRIFEAKISSVMEDFQAAATKVNGSGKGVSVEVQAIAQFQQVTTQKTLSGVELRESAQDAATFYSLATLSREQCVNSLTEQLETLDKQVQAAINSASGGDKLKAFKGYGKALNLMDEREGLNAMLRVCDGSGKGIPAPVEIDELVGHFDEASGSFKLGIVLEGTGSEKVKDCLMEKLGEKGYQITPIRVDDADESESDDEEEEEDEEKDDTGGYDAILEGKIKYEKAGNIAGSEMIRTDLSIKLINGKTKKVLKTFTGNGKEGRRDVKSSVSLAAHKICIKNIPQIAEAVDKYFKR